jgi:hypothetical protein
LEKLAATDRTTIVIEKQPEAECASFQRLERGEKVFVKVLEVRSVDERLHVTRKAKKPDTYSRQAGSCFVVYSRYSSKLLP